MRLTTSHLFLPALVLFIGSTRQAAPVTLDSRYDGGVFGSFRLEYSSGAPGLQLQQVTVDLESPLFLDPTFLPPGSLLPLPFLQGSGAADTGFAGVVGVFDGATSFTLLFDDFDAGEAFSFNVDVDSPCGNIFCQLSGSLTSGAEFAGTKLITTFGGPQYETASLEGLYTRVNDTSAVASVQGDVGAVPEPSTYALFGGGLLSIVFARRRLSAR